MASLTDLLSQATQPHVKVGVTDVDGVLRTKYLHRDKVLAAVDAGFGFCNVLFGWDSQDELYGHAATDPGFSDLPARLDPATLRRLPWENELPFLLADFSGAEGPLATACPRRLLRRIVDRAESLGFTPRFGPEYEWFVYAETPATAAAKGYRRLEPLTPGMYGYSGLRTGLNAPYFDDLFQQLGRFDVELEGLHTETGPGVLEAAISHRPALEAADRAILFKQGVRQISYRHGRLASFMAKPRADLPGCGGHLHQSLWRDGENAFHDPAAPAGMSATFRHYLAGQLALLPTLLPLLAPTVNSYKRYVAGSWAATRLNWGLDNRTVALRALPGSPKACRLETRLPGADANPYLAIAACLAAGLHGIERALPLDLPPVTGNAYEQEAGEPLPQDLGAAVRRCRGRTEAEKSDYHHVADLLGPDFLDHYLRTRDWEWNQYTRAVTDWEVRRYLEIT